MTWSSRAQQKGGNMSLNKTRKTPEPQNKPVSRARHPRNAEKGPMGTEGGSNHTAKKGATMQAAGGPRDNRSAMSWGPGKCRYNPQEKKSHIAKEWRSSLLYFARVRGSDHRGKKADYKVAIKGKPNFCIAESSMGVKKEKRCQSLDGRTSTVKGGRSSPSFL